MDGLYPTPEHMSTKIIPVNYIEDFIKNGCEHLIPNDPQVVTVSDVFRNNTPNVGENLTSDFKP